MISVQALCNTVLKKAFSENIPVTPMKLQKLLYFIYREYLRQTGRPLFSEPFETWAYGPVIPSVYDEFKAFKAKPINRFARDSQGNVYVLDENADPELTAYIVSIWERYKRKSGIELSQITHKPNSAWYKAYMEGSPILKFEDIQNDEVY